MIEYRVTLIIESRDDYYNVLRKKHVSSTRNAASLGLGACNFVSVQVFRNTALFFFALK
jgi:hypothetical protein